MAKTVLKDMKLSPLSGLPGSWTTSGVGPTDFTGAIAPDASNPDSRFIQSVTLNDIIEFNILSSDIANIPDGATIGTVTLRVRHNYQTGGAAAQIKFTYNGTEIGTVMSSGTKLTELQNFAVNPITSNPWTKAELVAGVFGIKQVTIAGGGRNYFVYQLWIRPSWSPPTPFSPAQVLVAGGETVTIQNGPGNFQSGFTTLTVDGSGVSHTVVNPTTITFTAPAHAIGFVPVVVTANGSLNYGYFALAGNFSNPDTLEYIDPNVSASGGSSADFNYDITGGINIGGQLDGTSAMVAIVDASGIYTLVPGQTFDRVYARSGSVLTVDLKIPDPFAKLGYFGD